ncbi:MAG: hypothetical protein COY39_03805 [Alphaproteobacteria bacterium CG_4_10_14_0_8_um_filter_37_21]|nr:MAG: hypothetical protein COY39_03805 [Alphaproteobacteria bacterium CG_4_10_14_0_8_um_filter_37_21]
MNKKTFLLGFLSLTAFNVPSNAMASDVSSLLKKAFPQSMFSSKCSSGNAKINWNLVAQAEKAGGGRTIEKKAADRIKPCLDGSNPNYQKKFKENCGLASADSQAKEKYCGSGIALINKQENPFGDDDEQEDSFEGAQQQPVMGTPMQGQGNYFGGAQQQPVMGTPMQGQGNNFGGAQQQQPVMGTPMQGQGNMNNVDAARIETLEQQLQELTQYIQQLVPFVQQLSEQVQLLQSQQQQGGFSGQQQGGFGGQQQYNQQQGGYGQQQYTQPQGGYGQQQYTQPQGGYGGD